MGAAEAHGVIAGMVCAGDSDQWLAAIFESRERRELLAAEERDALEGLFYETKRRLEEENFEFDLFLPEEETPLSRRASALADWCKGFLYGVGKAGPQRGLPADCGEILRDLVEISKLDADAEGNEDEEAFAELNEYVRVGVQLIRTELRQQSERTCRR